MASFAERLRAHGAHVASIGMHCDSEETTKQALILPLLDILGYSPYDPLKVRGEYQADLPGVKRSERVDFALFSEGKLVMFIEAKSYIEELVNHAPQLTRYFNATQSVCLAALTNGREWRFFTDLKRHNLMDDEPFLIVDFTNLKEADIAELQRFRYGAIEVDSLHSVAEELVYLSTFQAVIAGALSDIDPDFVRFVATKALPSLRLTHKTLDAITPLVKRALAQAMSNMLVSRLGAQTSTTPVPEPVKPDAATEEAVDPERPGVVTTAEEKRLYAAALDLLGGRIEAGDIVAKDTGSYYALLYRGKINRWLLRYDVNRKRPAVQFQMPLTEEHRHELERSGLEMGASDSIFLDSPEHIYRVAGLLFDSLAYCRDDANFKRTSAPEAAD
jgi:predicted type IV restriction endonuclease